MPRIHRNENKIKTKTKTLAKIQYPVTKRSND